MQPEEAADELTREAEGLGLYAEETPPGDPVTEAEPPVPPDGITPFAEEGAEVDADLLPVKLLKGIEVTTGYVNDIKVVVAILTLVDPEGFKEEGMLLVMSSEDGMTAAKAIKAVAATVSPSHKQTASRDASL